MILNLKYLSLFNETSIKNNLTQALRIVLASFASLNLIINLLFSSAILLLDRILVKSNDVLSRAGHITEIIEYAYRIIIMLFLYLTNKDTDEWVYILTLFI